MSFEKIIEEIRDERAKQFSLPGSEWDLKNTPNDWIAIAGHYLTDSAKRKGQDPDMTEWHTNMVKAAAVIIAALEHQSHMEENQQLK
jgi:hypothetical protein